MCAVSICSPDCENIYFASASHHVCIYALLTELMICLGGGGGYRRRPWWWCRDDEMAVKTIILLFIATTNSGCGRVWLLPGQIAPTSVWCMWIAEVGNPKRMPRNWMNVICGKCHSYYSYTQFYYVCDAASNEQYSTGMETVVVAAWWWCSCSCSLRKVTGYVKFMRMMEYDIYVRSEMVFLQRRLSGIIIIWANEVKACLVFIHIICQIFSRRRSHERIVTNGNKGIFRGIVLQLAKFVRLPHLRWRRSL